MEQRDTNRSYARQLLVSFGVALGASMCLGSLFLFEQMETMSPSENLGLLSVIAGLLRFVLVAVVLAVPCSMLGLLLSKTRKRSLQILIVLLTIIFCQGFWEGLANVYRMGAFAQCAHRSQALVEAIKDYKAQNGRLPENLGELVPKYFPSIPQTGITAYPDYSYCHGELANRRYDGNPWALVINTPENLMDFSSFFYLPNQNYPELGHGGRIEKIGDWAYVHE